MPINPMQQETVLEGHKVITTIFNYDAGTEIAFELMQKAAPVVQLLFLPNLDDMDEVAKVGLPVLMQVAGNMKPVEWSALLKKLLANTTIYMPVDGQTQSLDLMLPDHRDKAFRGRIALSMKVALFVIKSNFADFFGAPALSGLLSRAQKQ